MISKFDSVTLECQICSIDLILYVSSHLSAVASSHPRRRSSPSQQKTREIFFTCVLLCEFLQFSYLIPHGAHVRFIQLVRVSRIKTGDDGVCVKCAYSSCASKM